MKMFATTLKLTICLCLIVLLFSAFNLHAFCVVNETDAVVFVQQKNSPKILDNEVLGSGVNRCWDIDKQLGEGGICPNCRPVIEVLRQNTNITDSARIGTLTPICGDLSLYPDRTWCIQNPGNKVCLHPERIARIIAVVGHNGSYRCELR